MSFTSSLQRACAKLDFHDTPQQKRKLETLNALYDMRLHLSSITPNVKRISEEKKERIFSLKRQKRKHLSLPLECLTIFGVYFYK
jgi:hypothetical protein